MASKDLQYFDNDVYMQLGHFLWSWKLCSGCLGAATCIGHICPTQLLQRCKRYFQFYRAALSTYSEKLPTETTHVLKTHGDLWKVIQILRDNPMITRSEFALLLTTEPSAQVSLSREAEFLRAITLSVQVMSMIDCSALHHGSDRLEKGSARVHWKDSVPFSKYLEDLFPTKNDVIFSYPENDSIGEARSSLRANKLKKHLGLTFRPTHDIGNHLRLHRKERVLEVYHYASFVKEQLRLSQGLGDWSTPGNSIRHGVLPRQLVLEVLDSLQTILFPVSDPKSKKLLESLVSTSGFDPELLRYEFNSICRVDEDTVAYIYFADRLSDLYNELQDPHPQGWLERKLERKSGARYVMLATLIGVALAVLLGILSLAVSSYQTWIAYQAWKYPVSNNT